MNAPNNPNKPVMTLNVPPELLKQAGMNEKESEAFNIAINLPMFQQSIGSFGKKMVVEGFKQGLVVGILVTAGVAILATLL